MSGPGSWARSLARRLVRARLGDYRIEVVSPGPGARRLEGAWRVAVIGGGLAGLSAAESLARRGFTVTVFERNSSIGGKIGGGYATDPDGASVAIDHGFHAYFRHYHNLTALMQRAGVPPMRAIDDYVIVSADGDVARFGDVETTPLLNVIDLAAKGFYRPGEVAGRTTRTRMHELLRYDPVRTFRDLDDVSFSTFAEDARLPPKLRRVFATFARAFFAEEHRLSCAELIRGFHAYFLSHDEGLLYDFPTAPAGDGVIAPLAQHLGGLGVRFVMDAPVETVALDGHDVVIGGMRFDSCVIAVPAVTARDLVAASPDLAAAIPTAAAKLARMERGARYAVLRVWLDVDPCADLPVFVSTDRVRVLDAVASYHRITCADAEWARRVGGAVLELHSYAIPDDVDDGQVRGALLTELSTFFPVARTARVLGDHLAIRDDFTARHVGMARHRPGTITDDDRIVLAGDWVELPIPALLMEGACSSGIYAANAIAAQKEVSADSIWSVPLRGAFAF